MRGYLLDTHILIWLISNPKKLSPTAKAIIQNTDNQLFYSPLSFCEMAIKVSTGKLIMNNNWQIAYYQLLINKDIAPLPQSYQDAIALQNLPFHHKDPFDRILRVS